MILLGACSAENEITDSFDGEGSPIRIGARIEEALHSRSEVYMPYGEVTTGTYYLTYPIYATGSDVATVNFDVPAAEGIGIVTTSAGRELTWKNVRTINSTTNQRATFYLDNVKPDDANSLVISTSDFRNTYKAAVFDSIAGTNDLLAGTLANVAYDTEELSFPLSHQMSRLKLIVMVNNNYEAGSSDFVNLSDAQVSLSNICCEVTSYNRETMTLTNAAGLSDLQIVDTSSDEYDWLLKPDFETSDEGAQTAGGEDATTQVYISQNIVLPPQQVNTISNRPILTITAGGRNYWGYLPASMIDEAPNPSQVTTFQFLKGYIMTVRVHVNAPERMLIFEPVVIEDWNNVGSQRLQGTETTGGNNN